MGTRFRIPVWRSQPKVLINPKEEIVAELLLAILLGVGFYAGFVGSRHELDPVTDQLKLLLGRSLTRQND